MQNIVCCFFVTGDPLDPFLVQNGQTYISGDPHYLGIEIVYSCHPGYELQGDSTVQCFNGHFSKPTPTCIPTTGRGMTSGWFLSLESKKDILIPKTLIALNK